MLSDFQYCIQLMLKNQVNIKTHPKILTTSITISTVGLQLLRCIAGNYSCCVLQSILEVSYLGFFRHQQLSNWWQLLSPTSQQPTGRSLLFLVLKITVFALINIPISVMFSNDVIFNYIPGVDVTVTINGIHLGGGTIIAKMQLNECHLW